VTDGFPSVPPFPSFPLASSERIYDSPWVGLRRDLIRLADARLQEYHVIEVTPAVCVVPELEDGSLAMIWQLRHPHGKTHWEIPAGRLHADEDPAAGAARELREETGLEAASIEPLGNFYPTNGISAHYAYAFVARGCRQASAQELDVSERISVHAISREAVRAKLLSAGFEDAFTALALFYYFAR
jgi:ADP-ribose pyrophosphatase